MYFKDTLFGLILLQWTATTNAFVAPSQVRGFGVTTCGAGDSPATVMSAKKILISFDGSGNGEVTDNPRGKNAGVNSYTNVLRLHVLAGGSLDLDPSKATGVDGSDQICLYCNGVGGDTTLIPEWWGERVAKDVDDVIENVNFGLGIMTGQIDSMKKKLEKHYEKDDELYIIGFSRGSTAARVFVSQLENEGITTVDTNEIHNPHVEFLGCFDTVSEQALKNDGVKMLVNRKIVNSRCVGEVDGKLPMNVKTAVHNLSLDDNRWVGLTPETFLQFIRDFNIRDFFPYPPVFMDSKDDRVNEVWFPGQHSDVGGGWADHGLSDNSGVYMQEWLESKGIKFYTPEEIPADRFIIPESVPQSKGITVRAEDIAMKPDPAANNHIDPDHDQPRPVVTVHENKEMVKKGIVRIHESVLEHWNANGEAYTVNKNLMNNELHADLVVVGSLNKEDEEKTNELKKKIKESR